MPGTKPGRPLTAKQQRFVAEYLVDLNATQAAIRAGYSAKRADAIGWENLRNPEIAAALAASQAKQIEAAEVKATRVLEEYRRIAFRNLAQIFDDQDQGRLLPIRQMPAEVRAMLASVKTTKKNLTVGDGVQEEVVEVKCWDKIRALDALAKHLGLLDEHAHVDLSVTDALNAVKRRNLARSERRGRRRSYGR